MDEERDVHERISRLPALPAPLDPRVAESFAGTRARGGSILNLHLVHAHAPRLMAARRAFVQAMRNECDTPRRLRELAIIRAAQLAGCDYEEGHHLGLAVEAGLSGAAVAAIATWRERRELFEPSELAVLAYVDEVCGCRGEVSDATFDELAAHLGPAEIVELTTCATAYYGSGLYVKALGILPDLPDRHPAPGRF